MAVILIVSGNIGKNINLKYLTNADTNKSNKVLNFSLASPQYIRKTIHGEEKLETTHVEWFECDYWNRKAEHFEKVLKKGMPITVLGKEFISFYDKAGEKIKSRKIKVDNILLNLNSTRVEEVLIKTNASDEVKDDIDINDTNF